VKEKLFSGSKSEGNFKSSAKAKELKVKATKRSVHKKLKNLFFKIYTPILIFLRREKHGRS